MYGAMLFLILFMLWGGGDVSCCAQVYVSNHSWYATLRRGLSFLVFAFFVGFNVSFIGGFVLVVCLVKF